MRSNTPITAAVGWTEIAPRGDAPELLVEASGRLRHLDSTGRCLHDFGPVGPVECPLAYDPVSRVAFRYVCEAGFGRKDFSQIRAFRLGERTSYPVMELPVNQWVLWFFVWIGREGGAGGQLLGLQAVDQPVDGQVCLQHRLFTLNPLDAVLECARFVGMPLSRSRGVRGGASWSFPARKGRMWWG